eukprot:gene16016-19063_t
MSSSVSNLLASDKESLIVRSWKPQGPTIATVTFIHGMGEHSGRYEHVFSKFAAEGIEVNTFDQRGHGKSGGTRGHSPSIEQSLKDVTLIAAKADESLPHFIYGHSFGGQLALHYTLRKKEHPPTGTIVTSPFIKLATKVSPVKIFFGNIFASIAPSKTVDNGINASHIAKDEEVVKAYKEDKLIHNKVSLVQGRWMLAKGEQLIDLAPQFTTPVLMIHAADDKITCPKASQTFFDRSVSTDKSIHLWENMYHEVHNEKDQDKVIQCIIDWIKARLAVVPSTNDISVPAAPSDQPIDTTTTTSTAAAEVVAPVVAETVAPVVVEAVVAPVETAPVETAPVETAPVVVEAAVVAPVVEEPIAEVVAPVVVEAVVAPVETAPVETAPAVVEAVVVAPVVEEPIAEVVAPVVEEPVVVEAVAPVVVADTPVEIATPVVEEPVAVEVVAPVVEEPVVVEAVAPV